MKRIVGTILKLQLIACIVFVADISAIIPQELNTSQNLFPNVSGTAKIDSLNNYASLFENKNAKIRKEIAEYALELANEEKYDLGIMQAYQNIGESYNVESMTDSSLFFLKKAAIIAEKNNDNLNQIIIYQNIANQYSNKILLDSSLAYNKKAMKSAEVLKDSASISILMNSIGITNWRKGRYNTALKLYKTSLQINRKLKNYKQIVRSLNNIGAAYFHLGNMNLALEYYIEASEVKQSIDSLVSPIIVNNIGLVYLELNDDSLAQEYFTRALNIANSTNSKLGIAYSYFNFGDLYYRQEKFNLAIEAYSKAQILYSEINDFNGVIKTSNYIGRVYLKRNQFKLAEEKFKLAYEKSKSYGLILTQIEASINLSKIQILRGDYKEAEANLLAVFKLAKQEELGQKKLEVYLQLVEVSKMQEDYRKALLFHQKYDSLKDSLYNEQTVRINSETKEKYEAQQVENRNLYLQNINRIQKERLERQEYNILQVIWGLLFLSIIVLYLIYLNSVRRKQNTELLKAKEQVDLINTKLNETNELLAKSNSTKDRFFSIIAHDLKNPFNTLLGASQILNTDDGSLSVEERTELIQIIANDTQKLYSLLENLLYWSRSQTGNLKAQKVKINLHKLVSEVIQLYKSSMDRKEIKSVIEISDKYFILFDEFMFNTIIRNLISNAIKFSYSDGTIKFTATEVENKILLSIKDHGVGISSANLSKLFDESSDFKALGTDNEKGTGLGLILCREFAAENNAIISAESSPDDGTTFKLLLEKAV